MKNNMSLIIILIAVLSSAMSAHEPVYFADENLKAAVEEALGVIDPTPADMLELIELEAKERGIANLTGLEHATNLNWLELSDNQITDISVLSSLANIERLELNENQISDISLLSDLTSLVWLELENNQITDISVLSGLTSLSALRLNYNQISDISPLSGLTDLWTLFIRCNQITDISSLSDLTRLLSLDLSENQISDISVMSGFIDLRILDINGNNVSDISALSNLMYLHSLSLPSNPISDLSPLSNLTSLDWLQLGYNQISDISPLSNLTKLEWLSLWHNQISDISPLSSLTNLEWLYVNNNQIVDVSPLSGLTKLRWLFVDNNQISDISALSNLTSLEQLKLFENPLNADAYNIYIPLIQSYGTNVYYDPPVWRTLTVSSTAGGSVIEPGEGDFDYPSRTVVTVNAVAEPGYYFVEWVGTAVNVGKVADTFSADTTVTLDRNYTLQANFERVRLALYVDDDAEDDPGPGDPQVSDPSEDGSAEHPYDTIQEAIDAAGHGDMVLVYPGTYQEEIVFLGKAITVQGVATSDGIPMLENPGDFAASFYNGEGPDSVLKNFIIKNSFMAVFIADSSPTISNITVVDNTYGIEAYADSEPDISNSIFWNNTDDDLFQCEARYSCIERTVPGEGNIDADPLFVDPNNDDYHLRSERGRYWPEHDVWVLDKITSPCVDGGDPAFEPLDEPRPNGDRINMGAYGGTAFASMSETSITVVQDDILPPEVVEQVWGITGGFWSNDRPWFIALFQNNSDYTITKITIRIRLTDRETNEQQWYEVVLGPPGAVIPPGETVVLTGDVGATRGDRDFYWEIVEMRGYRN